MWLNHPPWRPPLKTRSSHDITDLDIQSHIDRARSGGEDSRTWIVSQYSPIAHRVALRYVDREEAKDLAHDALIKMLVRLDRYDSQWSFKTWVSTITRNTCIDWLRRRRRLASYEPGPIVCEVALPDESLVDAQTRAAVRSALDGLPTMYREVLELHHYQDLKYREIAETLDVPIGTVMNRIFRARKKMAHSIQRYAA